MLTKVQSPVSPAPASDEVLGRVRDLLPNNQDERLWVLKELLGEAACSEVGIYPIPQTFLLSVVIPVYNEERWIREVVRRVQAVDMPKEIVIVEDCSTDNTRAILRELEAEHENVRVFFQPKNSGKGAALREGFKQAVGDVILVQDADLEYDPAEYPRLLQPILEDKADVVYGSRYIGEKHRVLNFWHTLCNKMLTLASNMFTSLNLTDMETCYKVFRREVLQGMTLRSNRFGFEPEVTAKIARGKPAWRVFEVPISYSGRTYAEGKKIGIKDAFNALYCILRYSCFD